MKRRSGYIWIIAGIALALLAGLAAMWVILRLAPAATQPAELVPEIDVVVAAHFIPLRRLIGHDDVKLQSIPSDVVPENAALSEEQVVGRLALIPFSPGEMILTNKVISPTATGRQVGLLMDDDKVAMAFPAQDLMSLSHLLQTGDKVDILFSIPVGATDEQSGRLVTFNSLQNVEIAMIVYEGDVDTLEGIEAAVRSAYPLSIVFALDPQDALVLKHLQDMEGIVSLVVRAPGAPERFTTEPVDIQYLMDRYQMRIPVFP